MAYVKHTWECGEILTPEAMNRIENGIEEAIEGGVNSYPTYPYCMY